MVGTEIEEPDMDLEGFCFRGDGVILGAGASLWDGELEDSLELLSSSLISIGLIKLFSLILVCFEKPKLKVKRSYQIRSIREYLLCIHMIDELHIRVKPPDNAISSG